MIFGIPTRYCAGLTIYLAGPLFSEAERLWLAETKRMIIHTARKHNRHVNVVWPYELISPEEIKTLGECARIEIFDRCKSALNDTNVLIALLDGPQVDDGTSWELGYYFCRRSMDRLAKLKMQRIIYGIRTDFRTAGESAAAIVNIMCEKACDRVFLNRKSLLAVIEGHFKEGDLYVPPQKHTEDR